ncbi:VOC family protein [Streptantibioticus ferralitis]|uniref:VOC family protein n=1 Tax=Streptantibioticus ferralitis TaxID=236510 RepID=A0ABT5Z0U9_9ACTN|nr:VOC family protein [Streptantibioticus ferralitis]MDF2257468.1 VOC family protein [Streptantibioticus ferralitis]
MLRTSHLVYKVDDVRALVRDFTDLGFTVEYGSDPARAHNALLWFAEGPFIEFFQLHTAFRLLRWPLGAAYGPGAGERLTRWARPGEGWRDLALETDESALHQTRTTLRAAGVPLSRVVKGRRTRPDGQLVRYQFLAPRPSRLPFVVSAYDPPQRPAHVVHPNGAHGIARVRMGVADADRRCFDALIGEDRWLAVEPAPRTGLLGVELAGLKADLDPDKLHGAAFTAAVPKG